MTKTIYVLTEGEYSDYGITAVFETRELAEEHKRFLETNERNSMCFNIEEFTLNVSPPKRVCVSDVLLSNGESNGKSHYTWNYNVENHERVTTRRTWGSNNPGITLVRGYGKDEESALKSARDYRAKHLAEKNNIS